MILPSIYLAYDLIMDSAFRKSAQRFVSQNFNFEKSRILTTTFTREGGKKIEVAIAGEPLSDEMIGHLKKQMPVFDLQNVHLSIIQPDNLNARHLSALKSASLLNESQSRVEQIINLQQEIRKLQSKDRHLPDIAKEVNVLFPSLVSVSFGDLLTENVQKVSSVRAPSLFVKWKRPVSQTEKKRLEVFLRLRLKNDQITIHEIQ